MARLSQTLGPDSLLGQDLPTYKFDKKELLRTKIKRSTKREKLQAQQTFYLNQWAKVENNLYAQAYIMNQLVWHLIMTTNQWNILLKLRQR
jgi:hypothetical protein